MSVKTLAAALIFCATITAPALAGTYVVPGTASVWLAGQSGGATVSGYFGTDTAPANSPTAVTFTGSTISFIASGMTSVNAGGCYAGAAGGCYSDESGDSPSPWGGEYNGPASALVGIFTDGTTPPLTTQNGYTGPGNFVAGPDYQNPANVGPGTYSPALDQIFIIGTGSGETFNVPTGAQALYLGIADALGASGNNLGSLTVQTPGAVPEPASWTMLLAGFGLVGATLRRPRRRAIRAA